MSYVNKAGVKKKELVGQIANSPFEEANSEKKQLCRI